MRLLPVTADGSMRIFNQEVEACGYRIPARTTVWMYRFTMQNSPRYWEDPGSFLPVSQRHKNLCAGPPGATGTESLSNCVLPVGENTKGWGRGESAGAAAVVEAASSSTAILPPPALLPAGALAGARRRVLHP